MRKRTLARELALQLLYQIDLRGPEVLEDADPFLERSSDDPDVLRFAKELTLGCWEHRAGIDPKIEEVAKNWQISRMAAIDRNILRLAVYEMLFRNDIPPLASINEAIELAKRYSTKNSGPFVNGILDAIRLRNKPAQPSSETKPQ